MFEQYGTPGGSDDRVPVQRTTNRLVLGIALIAGVALTIGLCWLMLTKHPLGWSAVPRELRALPPNATPGDQLRALEASRRYHVRELVVFGILEPLLFLVIHRLRVGRQAGAAAVGVTTAGALLTYVTGSLAPGIVGAIAGAYCLFSIKVADQWEKCIVLRFGRYHRLCGPGMFRIVPIVDSVAASLDERVRTTAVHAEAVLTRDSVPVHVDAVIFWIVSDVERAVLELQDFDRTVTLVAQTALLESIGRHDLGEMIAERGSLGRDLQGILEEKTAPWGVTLQSVNILDLRLPRSLQDALSRQAQAERERQARIIFGNAEVELAAKFAEASAAYKDDPIALHLRAMNMLYEVIKEKGTMVVVPASGLRRRAGRAGRAGGVRRT